MHFQPPARRSRLFVVRHGDTEWTDARRHTGRTDIPLNAEGERRAGLLAARLAGRTFAAVFTSPLARARRTCELAGLASGARVARDLSEWDYGEFEGLTTEEIEVGRPDWNLFRDGGPGGETPAQVAARADRFLAEARSHVGDVVAFSSGHMIRMIAARWLGLPPLAAQGFAAATASVGVLGYEHRGTRPIIELWNDVGRPGDSG